jgi:uncharacterized protein YkwD
LLSVPVRPLARVLPVALAAAAFVAPASAGARSTSHVRAHRASACAHTGATPTRRNLASIRAAILCLHNQIRAQHRLPRLRANRKLAKAAVGHSRHMVRGRYFDHTDPNGVTFVQRVLSAGYVRRTQGWALGENIAWGTGSLATPRAIMNAWMKSPGHRANILRRSYREIGIGISLGVPSAGGSGATVTADFGARR